MKFQLNKTAEINPYAQIDKKSTERVITSEQKKPFQQSY